MADVKLVRRYVESGGSCEHCGNGWRLFECSCGKGVCRACALALGTVFHGNAPLRLPPPLPWHVARCFSNTFHKVRNGHQSLQFMTWLNTPTLNQLLTRERASYAGRPSFFRP